MKSLNKLSCFYRDYDYTHIIRYFKRVWSILSHVKNKFFLFAFLFKNLLNLFAGIYLLNKKFFKNIYFNKNHPHDDFTNQYEHLIDFFSEDKLDDLNYEVYSMDKINKHYKITIVIPIYNCETFIHRTLMSIENQSFNLENIEILMINDASTDNTPKIINQYADKHFNFKAIHIKMGTGSAGIPRNLGLKLASAEYVMFLDHDDFLEINALEKLYNKITEYDCDVVYGTYALVDNNKPIKFAYPNEKHGFFNSLEDNPNAITIPPSIWTKLFKKEFLLENNILFPTILGEDAIFMAKALKNANGVYYLWDDIICYYNLNEQSYTSNLSYDYFVEGFISEKYLFNMFTDWGHKEYYSLRGQGILDYYINRFMLSNLDNDEIKKLMPLFNEFCQRLNQLNITPKNERNRTVFNYIINKDIKSLIKFKNYKPNKIKSISNKILKRVNKHSFW